MEVAINGGGGVNQDSAFQVMVEWKARGRGSRKSREVGEQAVCQVVESSGES